MRCKSLLLGGAMVLALSGAAGAQDGSSLGQNSQPAAQSQQSSDTSTTKTPAKHVTHRVLHHARHHVQHTASVHIRTTPAERVETNDLNREQLYSAQYRSGPSQYGPGPQAMQGEATYYPQEPGQNAGVTPTRRIPNGIPFQAATPAGGRADTPSLDQAHRQ
jgi:hypothetical protein